MTNKSLIKEIEQLLDDKLQPINDKIDMLLQLLLSDEPDEDEVINDDDNISFDDM